MCVCVGGVGVGGEGYNFATGCGLCDVLWYDMI